MSCFLICCEDLFVPCIGRHLKIVSSQWMNFIFLINDKKLLVNFDYSLSLSCRPSSCKFSDWWNSVFILLSEPSGFAILTEGWPLLSGAIKYQRVEINVHNWVAPYWKIERTRCWTVIDVNLVFSQLKLKASGVFVAHYTNKYLRFELVLTVEQKFVQVWKSWQN